jgi:hypothetical protein
MNPKDVVFTRQELCQLKEWAVYYYVNTDARLALPGSNSPMTEVEHLSLSWLQAATNLLAKKGCGVYIRPQLNQTTSEPDTEGV